jgi:uncharacterized membrane protein
MNKITRTFLTGLVTVIPVVASLYLLAWLVMASESVLGALMRSILPDDLYWPGMGMVLVIALIFLVGLFMRTWVAQRLFAWAETLLYRTPVVKSVYGPLRDLVIFMAEPRETGPMQVVAVRIGGTEARLVGYVTRSDLTELPQGINGQDSLAVYLPFSYQIGGYMAIMPRSAVEPLDMSFEDAMRLTLTAGLSAKAGIHGPN